MCGQSSFGRLTDSVWYDMRVHMNIMNTYQLIQKSKHTEVHGLCPWTPGFCSAQPVCNCLPAHIIVNWYHVFTVKIMLSTATASAVLRRVHKIAKSDLASSCLSCLLASNGLALTGWIFMKFYIWVFFKKKPVEKIQVSLKLEKNNGFFTWRAVYIFGWSRSLLRMRNVTDKSFRENQKTHFMFNNFVLKNNVIEIMWKNIVERSRPQMTV